MYPYQELTQITVYSSDECWLLCGQVAYTDLNKIVFSTSLPHKFSQLRINCIALHLLIFYLEVAYINSKILNFYVLALYKYLSNWINCSFYLNEDILRKENVILIVTLININVIWLGYNSIFSKVVEHRNYFSKCPNWGLVKIY